MQKSFSDLEYAAKKKLTRRDRFLAEIDSVTPWGKLHKLIEPFYPNLTLRYIAPSNIRTNETDAIQFLLVTIRYKRLSKIKTDIV